MKSDWFVPRPGLRFPKGLRYAIAVRGTRERVYLIIGKEPFVACLRAVLPELKYAHVVLEGR